VDDCCGQGGTALPKFGHPNSAPQPIVLSWVGQSLGCASKLRFFPIGRNERNLPTDNDFKSPQDFMQKMDSGELDGNLASGIKKLTREQLEEIVQILMERGTKQRSTSAGKQI
jgi:hypothetical protein